MDFTPWASVIAACVTALGVNGAVFLGFFLAGRNETAKLKARGDAAPVTSRVAGVEAASQTVGKAVAEVDVLGQLALVRETLTRVEVRVKGLASSMEHAHERARTDFDRWKTASTEYLGFLKLFRIHESLGLRLMSRSPSAITTEQMNAVFTMQDRRVDLRLKWAAATEELRASLPFGSPPCERAVAATRTLTELVERYVSDPTDDGLRDFEVKIEAARQAVLAADADFLLGLREGRST